MTAPLTDEQVAHAVADYDDVTVTNALAREVQAYRALRPDCPTCEGRGYDNKRVVHLSNDDQGTSSYANCPACTDGKMPLDKWVALLVENAERLHDALINHPNPTALASAVDRHDAVLKMVPKVAE